MDAGLNNVISWFLEGILVSLMLLFFVFVRILLERSDLLLPANNLDCSTEQDYTEIDSLSLSLLTILLSKYLLHVD